MKLPEAAQAVFIILGVILVLFALMAAAFYVISAFVPRKVRAVGFSPDGQLLAVQAGWDILVLDPSTGQERWGRPISFMGAFTFVGAFGLEGSLCCAFASETSVLATADPGGVFVYDAASGKRLRSFRMELDPRGVAISPDGNMVVVAHKKGLQLWVRGTETVGRLPNLTHHPGPLTCAAFSPDGALLATGGDGIALWDLHRSQVIARLAGHGGPVTSVVFSPAGDRLVSGSEDATVRVWEVASRAEVHCLSGHSGPVTSVAVNPDGPVVASAGADGTVRLWDLERGQELQRLDGHTGRVNAVVFSRDGAQVVSGGDDRSVRAWDAASGAPLRQWVAKRDGLFSVRFVLQ
jgi:WD40 repeat protein